MGQNVRDSEYSKGELKQLKRLADEAYARELATALRELRQQFDAWEASSISPFALSDAIHEFHDGVARDLWKSYQPRFAAILVESALERGVLTDADVPEALRGKLAANRLVYGPR